MKKMASIDESVQKEWIKNLWMNCNKSGVKNETLWNRVTEMVHAFNINGDNNPQGDANFRRMKPDSVPVGVDCTLSPILPPSAIEALQSRTEFCTAVAAAAAAASSSSTNTTTVTTSNGLVKRLVCSPDLPVYPVRDPLPAPEAVNTVDSSQSPTQGLLQQKLYQCTLCMESFSQKASLTAHLKSHNKEGEDPYQCNFCGKTFAVPARLTRHYRTHTGEKPYQCEYCNKSFSVKENLSVHKRIHTKERPYKCDVCDRAFEHSGKLHRHMRIHTGERPHKCNICMKTFIQSGQLVIHLRTHTGEKPYVCKCCNKGFTCSKQLKVHTRTHTGEKPYACDICGKSFGYNHVLKLHQVAHFGEKVYKCTICKETFTSKKSMETHIKMSHSDSNPSRNGEGELSSSSSSASDKENKLDAGVLLLESQHTSSRCGDTLTLSPSPLAGPILQESPQPAPSASPIHYDSSYIRSMTSINSYHQMYPSVTKTTPAASSAHHRQGLNAALLAAAAAVVQCGGGDPMHLSYAGENPETLPPPHRYPSKFQIPVAAMDAARFYTSASPLSSFSDSSRSSPSPKMEIVEAKYSEDPSMYIFNEPKYCRDSDQANSTIASSSVIFQVPFSERLTPTSSTSSGPLSPERADQMAPSRNEERNLPPRKRTKMILESMEKDRAEDTNFRYSSVIHYAKASQRT